MDEERKGGIIAVYLAGHLVDFEAEEEYEFPNYQLAVIKVNGT